MGETSSMPLSNETKAEILIAELEISAQWLNVEREMADRMVNHFLTLTIASLGGYILIVTNQLQKCLEKAYALLISFILLVFGFSVFIRLVKRHLDGKIMVKSREKIRSMIGNLDKSLESHYEDMKRISDTLDKSWHGKVNRFGGAGVTIASINSLLTAFLIGYGYSFGKELHISDYLLYAVLGGLLVMAFQIIFYFKREKFIETTMKDRAEKKSE